MPNIVKITVAQLDAYLIANKKAKISLNDYIKSLQTEDIEVIADLSAINFQLYKFDLSHTNLSGTILDGINFSGKDIILKHANLSGASMKDIRFTDGISLKGVKLGSIELRSDVFQACQLAEAEYELNSPRILMMQLTDAQLKQYHDSNPKINLNQYLQKSYGHQYPNLTIIADLSDKVIDEKFNNADISGSRLTKATITGKIANLKMRDCITHATVFKECELTNPDLRGTCFADKSALLKKGVQATMFEGQIHLTSPKLSIGQNLNLAEMKGLLPSQHNSSVRIDGEPEFDPCYDPKLADVERHYKKLTRQDVERYINYIETLQDPENALDFTKFCQTEAAILKENQVADLSELDLSGLDLSYTKFDRCNFSFTNFAGSKFKDAKMNHCNFSCANMSSRLIDPQFHRLAALENLFNRYIYTPKQTSMAHGSFNNCDFTWADLTEVDAKETSFNNVIGINLNAHGIDISDTEANNSIFTGSHLDNVKALRLEAQNCDFSHTSSQRSKFLNSNLHATTFSHSNTSNSIFDNSDLTATNFSHSKTKDTYFQQCSFDKAKLPVRDFKIDNKTTINEADISHVKANEMSIDKINGEPIHDSSKLALQHKALSQEIQNNETKTLRKYSLLAIGAIALIAIAGPLAISYMAPALLSSIAVQSMINTAVLTIFSISADAISEKLFGVSAGINKFMANFLGAGKDITALNQDLIKEQQINENKARTIPATKIQIKQHEAEIKRATTERQNITSGHTKQHTTMLDREKARRNQSIQSQYRTT